MQAKNSLGRPAGDWCPMLLVLAVALSVQVPTRSWAALAVAQAAVRAGNTKYFQQNYAGAEADFAAAISNEPTWAVPYNNRGLARFHRGNFSGADADFDAAKSRETNYVSAYLNKGKSLAAQKRFAEAAAELEAALRLTNRNPTVCYNLGWVYDEQGRHAEARAQYTAALGLNPAYHEARLARGIAYAKADLVSSAEQDFYGVMMGATNNLLGAIAAYNLQLLRGPGVGFVNSQSARDYSDGVFLFSTEQHTAALARLQAARSNEPSVPDIPWMIQWVELKELDPSLADLALTEVQPLLKTITVQNTGPRVEGLSADIFIDGFKRGSSPAILRLFPSGYDVALRKQWLGYHWEWRGRIYTDGTPGGSDPVMVVPGHPLSRIYGIEPQMDTDKRRWGTEMSHEVPMENRSLDGDFLRHWQIAVLGLVICAHLRLSAVSTAWIRLSA